MYTTLIPWKHWYSGGIRTRVVCFWGGCDAHCASPLGPYHTSLICLHVQHYTSCYGRVVCMCIHTLMCIDTTYISNIYNSNIIHSLFSGIKRKLKRSTYNQYLHRPWTARKNLKSLKWLFVKSFFSNSPLKAASARSTKPVHSSFSEVIPKAAFHRIRRWAALQWVAIKDHSTFFQGKKIKPFWEHGSSFIYCRIIGLLQPARHGD
jgi:hypothetical protein